MKLDVSNHTDITNRGERSEIKKILERLDDDEKVLCVARQSRVKPGGSKITTPNTVFATNKRLIIRNPTMLGARENVEDFSYDKITGIKLEKGVFSSTFVITAPGMGTAARPGNKIGFAAWGRSEDGMIDAIPRDKAERILEIVREGMERFKKNSPTGRDWHIHSRRADKIRKAEGAGGAYRGRVLATKEGSAAKSIWLKTVTIVSR